MSETQRDDKHRDDEMPADDELQEPSVAKDPGEEPKAATPDDPEPSHHAVGIGVIESPEADAEGEG